MFRITQGTPNEFQVFVFCGIVMFVILAPVVIMSAAIYGWLTRPNVTETNENTTSLDAHMRDFQSQVIESHPSAGRVVLERYRFELSSTKDSEPVNEAAGRAVAGVSG